MGRHPGAAGLPPVMTQDRFRRLEGGELPPSVVEAINHLDRFQNLEIGGDSPADGAPSVSYAPMEKILCRHCGRPNEKEREICWACCKPVAAAAAPPAPPVNDFEIILDGQTHRASDPALPEDVRVLMDRIRKEGYSQDLLAEWRNWRATRRVMTRGVRPFFRGREGGADVRAFKGQRISVLRLDGKTYTTDQKDLPPEVREIFDYISANDVTPELMDHLRRHGTKVKFRPLTTPVPSDGDLDFWKSARDAGLPALLQTGPISSLLEDLKKNFILAVLIAAALFGVLRLLVALGRSG